MDQMTEVTPGPALSVEEFYDRLATDYDAMTTFEKRFIQEEPFFRLLVQRYRIGSALDAGCGTGFHSILLARLGVHVTAVDVSAGMLNELGRHMTRLGLDIQTVQAQFGDLPAKVAGPFDALFSMGNTLAHLHTKQELRTALGAFVRLLAPAGILFVQLLNYDRILHTRPDIQSVKETDLGTFTRSYEYAGDTIRFTVHKRPAQHAGGGEDRTQSVDLHPVMSADLTALLAETGFEDVRTYGSVAMEEYDPASSRDLVVLARRAGG
jgi:glycine/sarcosine N-methyltransferase